MEFLCHFVIISETLARSHSNPSFIYEISTSNFLFALTFMPLNTLPDKNRNQSTILRSFHNWAEIVWQTLGQIHIGFTTRKAEQFSHHVIAVCSPQTTTAEMCEKREWSRGIDHSVWTWGSQIQIFPRPTSLFSNPSPGRCFIPENDVHC